MKKAAHAAVLSAALLVAVGARAQDDSLDPGVFAKWLTSDGPKCVPVKEIGSVSHLTKLTYDQFQFVRALYVAMPPVSRTLPPGDTAVMARAGGKAMIALIAGEQACARFLAPDFIQRMLIQISHGEYGQIGPPV